MSKEPKKPMSDMDALFKIAKTLNNLDPETKARVWELLVVAYGRGQ